MGCPIIVPSVVAMILILSTLSGCDGSNSSTESDNQINDMPTYSQPERFAPSSYSQFTSLKGMTDISGTWLLLEDGTKKVVTSFSTDEAVTELSRYFARAVVRISNDPSLEGVYYIYTCSGYGASDFDTTYYVSTNTEVSLPYYYYSTYDYVHYPITVIDAVTLQNTNVTLNRDFSGWSISYALSFTYKKISDDPFENIASLVNLRSSSTGESGCFFEAEGAYKSIDENQSVHKVVSAGNYNFVDGYSLPTAYSSITRLFHLRMSSNNANLYSNSSVNFYLREGDTINASVSIQDNAAWYTVHAKKLGDPTLDDDVRFNIILR